MPISCEDIIENDEDKLWDKLSKKNSCPHAVICLFEILFPIFFILSLVQNSRQIINIITTIIYDKCVNNFWFQFKTDKNKIPKIMISKTNNLDKKTNKDFYEKYHIWIWVEFDNHHLLKTGKLVHEHPSPTKKNN